MEQAPYYILSVIFFNATISKEFPIFVLHKKKSKVKTKGSLKRIFRMISQVHVSFVKLKESPIMPYYFIICVHKLIWCNVIASIYWCISSLKLKLQMFFVMWELCLDGNCMILLFEELAVIICLSCLSGPTAPLTTERIQPISSG